MAPKFRTNRKTVHWDEKEVEQYFSNELPLMFEV